MPGLFASLNMAQRVLQAQQAALEVTQRNIANVNTRGYSRQRVNFIPGAVGEGLSGISIESFRNRFTDYRINQELQPQGESESLSTTLRQVETVLNENAGQGLQPALASFFNSFSSLANAPEDGSLRQQVLTRAGELARTVNRIYDQIQTVRSFQDRMVEDTVKEINAITSAIAALNVRVAAAQDPTTADQATFRDQRQEEIDKLAGLIDLSYWETEDGSITVTTKQGALLVIGNQSPGLQTALSVTSGVLEVRANGVNITSQIQSGKLGGILSARDVTLPGYLSALDDIAAILIARVNTQHAQGRDYNLSPGGNFFTPFVPIIPGSNFGAARAMTVAITDPNRIAAASLTGGRGDNTNAKLLAGIKDEKLFSAGTSTANQFYARLVFSVGTDLRSAENNLKTQENVLTQLQNQRDAFSGVNLDEEAVDIIRFQKAYEASARFVRVLDTLTEEALQILGR